MGGGGGRGLAPLRSWLGAWIFIGSWLKKVADRSFKVLYVSQFVQFVFLSNILVSALQCHTCADVARHTGQTSLECEDSYVQRHTPELLQGCSTLPLDSPPDAPNLAGKPSSRNKQVIFLFSTREGALIHRGCRRVVVKLKPGGGGRGRGTWFIGGVLANWALYRAPQDFSILWGIYLCRLNLRAHSAKPFTAWGLWGNDEL